MQEEKSTGMWEKVFCERSHWKLKHSVEDHTVDHWCDWFNWIPETQKDQSFLALKSKFIMVPRNKQDKSTHDLVQMSDVVLEWPGTYSPAHHHLNQMCLCPEIWALWTHWLIKLGMPWHYHQKEQNHMNSVKTSILVSDITNGQASLSTSSYSELPPFSSYSFRFLSCNGEITYQRIRETSGIQRKIVGVFSEFT